MTDAVLISIITSSAAVIMAGISAYYSYRSKVVSEQTRATSKETHKAVNSRLTEVLKLAKKSFVSKGILQEMQSQRVRDGRARGKCP